MRANILSKITKKPTLNGKPSPEELKEQKDMQLRALYSPASSYEPRNANMLAKTANTQKEKSIALQKEAELPARTRFGLMLTWNNPVFFIRIL